MYCQSLNTVIASDSFCGIFGSVLAFFGSTAVSYGRSEAANAEAADAFASRSSGDCTLARRRGFGEGSGEEEEEAREEEAREEVDGVGVGDPETGQGQN